MQKNLKPSPFLAAVFSTAGASLATAVSSIFVLRFLAQGLGAESFGLYSLSNRAFSLLAPLCGSMMGMAMSRNLSSTPNLEEKDRLMVAAFAWILFFTALLWGLGLLFHKSLASFFLGASSKTSLWFATLSYVTCFVFFALLEGIYFGSGEIFKANLWQWTLGVVGPLFIAFHFRNAPVRQIIFYFSGLYALSLIPLARKGWKIWETKPKEWRLAPIMRMLILFSAPRVAGGWLMTALLFIGPFMALHLISYKEAGFLMLAQTVYRVAEMGTGAFASVTLSKAGFLIGENRHAFLIERTHDLIQMSFDLGLYLALHLFLWSNDLVLLWLGSDYLGVAARMKILSLGVFPYFSYVLLRPIIEALEFKPVNTIHLGIACVSAFLLSFPLARLAGGLGLALATASGFILLGALTLFYFGKKDFSWQGIPSILLLNAALGAGVFLVQSRFFFVTGFPRLTGGIGLEILTGILYLGWLWRQKPRWLLEFRKRLFA